MVFNPVQHVFWFLAALTFHQCLFLILAGQKGVLQFLTPFFPPTLAQLLKERRACTASEYLSRQMHSKQCCSQCGCLAQLAAVLKPCIRWAFMCDLQQKLC